MVLGVAQKELFSPMCLLWVGKTGEEHNLVIPKNEPINISSLMTNKPRVEISKILVDRDIFLLTNLT